MKIKYILIAILIFVIGKITIDELFDNRQFKFEKYKSTEELEEAVKSKFLIGMELNQAIEKIQTSGAKCFTYKPGHYVKDCDTITQCDYYIWLLSLHPLRHYRIWFDANTKGIITSTETSLTKGLMLITW